MSLKSSLTNFWSAFRAEFWSSFNLGVSLALCLVILTASTLPPAEAKDRARSYTRQLEFDYVGWTVDALLVKLGQAALDAPRLLDQDEQKQVVLTYGFEVDEVPDPVQDLLAKEVDARGRQANMSFFAFTATPKGRTLELFGRRGESGKYEPFHLYSMRQAIDETYRRRKIQLAHNEANQITPIGP